MSAREWTEDELTALRENYERRGPSWDGWETLVPGRSSNAIAVKANVLGLSFDERRCARWDDEQNRLALGVLVGLARRLNRSPLAVVRHLDWLIRNADKLRRTREEGRWRR